MGISDIWDYIMEFLGGVKDGIADTFSNLGEFSVYGLGFSIAGVLFLLFTSQWLLDPFLSYMKDGSKIIVTIITYLGTAIACYFLGSHFQNS